MKIPKLFIFSSGAVWLKKSEALKSLFCTFSNAPPCNELVPDLETVVISETPPYSAALMFSLMRISAIALKEGNSSETAPAPPWPFKLNDPTVLIPSILIESCAGKVPATEMLPFESV